MNDVANLRDTIVPKSDQLNAEQLIGKPMTITVTEVRRSVDGDQPLAIHYNGDQGRPYKPCKSMRKVLIFAWGDDGRDWVGKSMTLYCDPNVKWGGVKVGGIRISHLSHVEADLALSLTATKGKKEPVIIKRLAVQKPKQQQATDDHDLGFDVAAVSAALESAAAKGMDALVAAWRATPKKARDMMGGSCPQGLKDTAAKADADRAAAAAAAAEQPETTELNEEDIF